jgi:endonuclease-3
MNKRELAKQIGRILDGLYPNPPIPLKHHSPFTLLVAVVLSAQCTDARVNIVTPALFAQADTAEKMARLSAEEIEDFIRTCGLAPQKSKAIHELSTILRDRYQGRVPQTFEELEELPGVGHKTASVVMAQAFHQPAFPVDTHIARCAVRWGLSSGKTVAAIEKDLKKLFPKREWIKRHLQIIYFAREYCPAKKHDEGLCPICKVVTRSPFKGP